MAISIATSGCAALVLGAAGGAGGSEAYQANEMEELEENHKAGKINEQEYEIHKQQINDTSAFQ